ncbi:MAG TPA: tetratricopeptide repeat protein [Candidatus Acidoferrales bacterium]|nr:tetratricopeptide repeat protein [Candidatus Acidoferrales bacterium]
MKIRMGACAICLMASFSMAPQFTQAQVKSGTRGRAVSAQEQALHDLLVKAKGEADGQNYAAAEADYVKYLAHKPDDAAAHFDLGYVYTAEQQTDKAIAEYRRAIALDPKMMAAHLNLGMSLLTENPKEAIAPLQKVVEMNYAFERGHFALGVAEERSGNTASAQKEYTVAVKLDPNDADAHAALGRLLLAEAKGSAAETEFRELLRLKPNDPEGQLGLAQSLVLQKKTADAAAALGNYLNANPADAKAQVMQAALLFQLGKNDDSLAALDRAAKDAPETLDALKLRSQIYFTKRDWAKTAAALQKAELLAPQDAVIHARLGHVLLETKDYANAARELTRSLQLDASSTDTLRDLISAEYLGKNFTGTLAALDLLAKRVPPNAGAWFVRGSCYDRLNEPKAALDAYNKFLAMNTNQNSDQYFEAAARARFLAHLLKQKGH